MVRMILFNLFPHFSRLFSANRRIPWLRTLNLIILWLLLLLFLAINILTKKTVASSPMDTIRVLQQPFSSQAHVRFAELLWDKGHVSRAKHEARIAADLEEERTVLGASTDAKNLLSKWESEPKRILQQYAFWSEIIRTRKDYADGFLFAATYAYQAGNIGEARKLIHQAALLNPLSTTIQQFRDVMK